MGIEVCVAGPPIISNVRRVAVSAHRLRCAKGLTGSTLKQIRARSSSVCDICNIYDDIIHVLESCKKFECQRAQWKRRVSSGNTEGSSLATRMQENMMQHLVTFIIDSGLEI